MIDDNNKDDAHNSGDYKGNDNGDGDGNDDDADKNNYKAMQYQEPACVLIRELELHDKMKSICVYFVYC